MNYRSTRVHFRAHLFTMSLKTKQEKKKKPWISPIKFLKTSWVPQSEACWPAQGRLCPLNRCPHSCKGLTLRRSKAAGTLFMRRWKVSYSAEAWQRKPFASPWLSTYDFLLIERSQTHSGPLPRSALFCGKRSSMKVRGQVPSNDWGFFFIFFFLDFSLRPANLIFWGFYFNRIHEHISLSV